MKTLDHWINGAPSAGTSDRMGPVFNPATGEQVAQVHLASGADVNTAVAAAKAALPAWSSLPPLRRARVMFRFNELILAHTDELAELITHEHGKTIEDAKGDILRGREVVEFACGIPHLMRGDFTEDVGSGVDAYSIRQSVGVCTGITPFNFPAMIPLWMFPLAIACGNTFILKPSERDPSCPFRLVELAHEAGVPEGVINMVNGDKEAVDALLTHPDVDAVSFVGSTPVASYIYATAAEHGKRVQALGGAKNHMVVMPDADLDQASDALISAGYGSAGQRCMAVSVAVAVGDDTGDALVEKLTPKIQELKIGPGTADDIEMGPVITKQAQDRILNLIDQGVADGATLAVDGRGLKLQGYEDGYFMGGTLFDHVTEDMSIYTEEVFGPVLVIVRANDYETALDMVNRNEYGNGTAIFTKDGDAARDFAERVQIGMVGVNVPIPVPVAYHSFGGWKRSLFGDTHMHGMEGVRFYTRLKAVTSRWPKSGVREGHSLNMPTMQ
ncbi:MAG: CoA-acylating methylmalonate-semialdehyde dehydrogenase [Rhodospirillaceae bacterium]|jgi:malonate-semialdehyde dehydrogenase (acetylating) / methylmalonate-semialdehyde dehydrogenase|nr:CoA-acylating methylmalonate-semialdehyde dehydrogenase [Rhodospirillaceae bacterium]MBT3931429.1 CoA-acylating methylmalonate-semialdehyde dehydrogenase [Rhodospirillaceae bacterium]MBT4772449.1 CoA-acylating methylmalonate-semialdehyde dehydrogenase [Rhodospirillaceae bacterium]MBT5358957.1 CoA-acylating methylmalonate-semialdehyde dehydrogenase [Rhodospirillaceae bacterium]MBT5769643.1 CoA-acylating methylmalonate-semialdehyde dehydrogenase [Rhodospirillaceae bacterium]